jgi:uncharacterized membrane protein (DUF2068 family)
LKETRDTDFIKRRAPTLWIIIGVKVGKGLLLLLLAAGLFKLIGKDVGDAFDSILRYVKIDPSLRFFARIGEKLDKITPSNLKWLASGSLLYALLLLVEGFGLIRRSWWAMWLAIGESAFFIPVEVFELVEKFTWLMFSILALNSLIVAYLIVNRDKLFHHHHPRQH